MYTDRRRRKSAARLTVIAAMAAMLVLAGCTGREESPNIDGNNGNSAEETDQMTNLPADEPVDTPAQGKSAAELEAAFDEAAAGTDTAADVLTFVESELPSASAEGADAMARRLLAYYNEHWAQAQAPFESTAVQNALLTADRLPSTKEEAAQLADAAARDAAVQALAGGYKLTSAEGYVFPEVDYGGLLDRIGAKLSPDLRDYMALLALESDHSAVTDAALAVGWDELAQRALQAERFLNDYPASPEYEAVLGLFERYMTIYVKGLDNSPIYDYATNLIDDEAKASYVRLTEDHPGTAAAAIAAEYAALLDQLGGQVMTGEGYNAEPAFEVSLFWDGMPSRVMALFAD